MATKPKTTPKSKPPEDNAGSNEVGDFLSKLEHPLKPELEAVRAIILGAHPDIREGIKWNAPSFRTTEYFATASIRNDAVLVILHKGAKVKDNSTTGIVIRDSDALLKWLAKERAMITFRDMKAIEAGRAELANIVRQWIS